MNFSLEPLAFSLSPLSPMFAQLSSIDAEFVKNVLILAVGVAGAVALFRHKRTDISPQPLVTKLAAEFVVKETCIATMREAEARLKSLEAALTADDVKRSAIYTRIETVRTELRADIQHLSDKVEVLPLRLLEVLKTNGRSEK